MSRFLPWLSLGLLPCVLSVASSVGAVPPRPPYATTAYTWTCDFPGEAIEVAPLEGALWLEAKHHGCCWTQEGSEYNERFYPGSDWCNDISVEVRILDADGTEVPGDTLYDSAEVDGYGDILWVAEEGPLDPSVTYTAQVFFSRYDGGMYGYYGSMFMEGEACAVAHSCLNGEICDPEASETGCQGHLDYEISFTTHGEASPTVQAPEVTATVVSAQWVPDFGCYVPRATFTVEPPAVDAWYQPYLRYNVYRVMGPTESEADRWGGMRMADGPVTSKAFDWRGWVPGVTDEYCARVEVRHMGPDTTVDTTVCLGPQVLPGLETNEGAPWTTVPEDGPFCSSDSEPVPDPVLLPDDPEPESSGTSSSSSGCAGGTSPTGGGAPWALLLLVGGALVPKRAPWARPRPTSTIHGHEHDSRFTIHERGIGNRIGNGNRRCVMGNGPLLRGFVPLLIAGILSLATVMACSPEAFA